MLGLTPYFLIRVVVVIGLVDPKPNDRRPLHIRRRPHLKGAEKPVTGAGEDVLNNAMSTREPCILLQP